jgi:hypothetical protein
MNPNTGKYLTDSEISALKEGYPFVFSFRGRFSAAKQFLLDIGWIYLILVFVIAQLPIPPGWYGFVSYKAIFIFIHFIYCLIFSLLVA